MELVVLSKLKTPNIGRTKNIKSIYNFYVSCCYSGINCNFSLNVTLFILLFSWILQKEMIDNSTAEVFSYNFTMELVDLSKD